MRGDDENSPYEDRHSSRRQVHPLEYFQERCQSSSAAPSGPMPADAPRGNLCRRMNCIASLTVLILRRPDPCGPGGSFSNQVMRSPCWRLLAGVSGAPLAAPATPLGGPACVRAGHAGRAVACRGAINIVVSRPCPTWASDPLIRRAGRNAADRPKDRDRQSGAASKDDWRCRLALYGRRVLSNAYCTRRQEKEEKKDQWEQTARRCGLRQPRTQRAPFVVVVDNRMFQVRGAGDTTLPGKRSQRPSANNAHRMDRFVQHRRLLGLLLGAAQRFSK